MSECQYLTPAQLTSLLAAGWTLESGPHATEAECLAVCGGTVAAGGCPAVPTTLHLTFTAGTGSCTALNGVSVPLVYNPATAKWTYTGTLNGVAVTITFFVFSGTDWELDVVGTHGPDGTGSAPATTCSPFNWSNTMLWSLDGALVCSGTETNTVTVTP